MDAPGDELLTVEEVTRILKVHEETVRRWIRNGELPARLLGSARGGYRIRRSDLDRFIDEKAEMGNAVRQGEP
jgi:excisionase family DNA binding protein